MKKAYKPLRVALPDMRFLMFLCCGFLCCSLAAAQRTIRFSGTVQFADDPLVSYYLELNVNGSRVTGYSITGYRTGSRLKATVEGYFKTPSDLIIREIGSLDGPESPYQTYCYFAAQLKLTIMMNGQHRWNGAFQSYQRNGTPCGNGIMTITDNAPPLEPVTKAVPKIERAKETRPVRITPPAQEKPAAPPPTPPPPPPPKKEVPKPIQVLLPQAAPKPQAPDSCQRSYHWSGDDFSFEIWDGWRPDGDVVSVQMNGEQLLNHVTLSQGKQRFKLHLHPGLNVLYIELFYEGNDPPNTPNLTLIDGSKTYDLAISGTSGEVVRICINR
ncbi:MAG: hypothetical protein JST06_09280 [Bacteroidetes bacterium]|nr:hypothetical protein [Bacteroidota bacterium]